jgi:hypothetical protein
MTRFIALLRRGERGQALIFFVGGITLIMGMAALAIDVGLWYSDRAVAQKDANAAAESAAPLYDPMVPSTFIDAQNQAWDVAASNGVVGGVNFNVPPEGCLGEQQTAIRIEVERESRLVFGGVFPGLDAPDTPGVALACVASLSSARAIRPFALIDDAGFDEQGPPSRCLDASGEIRFGQLCTLDLSTGGGTGGTRRPWRRLVDLNGSGACSNNFGFRLQTNIEQGAGVICDVGDPLYREEGDNTPSWDEVDDLLDAAQDGLENLMDNGNCDVAGDGDGEDDVELVLVTSGGAPASEPPGSDIHMRICDSDQLILVPVVAAVPPGNGATVMLEGFAPFFVTGCVNQGIFDADCSSGIDPDESFGIRGYFVKLAEPIASDEQIKGFDNYGTRRTFLYED